MSKPEIYWPGASGVNYGYWIVPLNGNFRTDPGNYIFAKQVAQDRWVPVYVGQTSDLEGRLSYHEKEACALRHGATHIHAHVSTAGEDARLREEADLIERWQPPCNG